MGPRVPRARLGSLHGRSARARTESVRGKHRWVSRQRRYQYCRGVHRPSAQWLSRGGRGGVWTASRRSARQSASTWQGHSHGGWCRLIVLTSSYCLSCEHSLAGSAVGGDGCAIGSVAWAGLVNIRRAQRRVRVATPRNALAYSAQLRLCTNKNDAVFPSRRPGVCRQPRIINSTFIIQGHGHQTRTLTGSEHTPFRTENSQLPASTHLQDLALRPSPPPTTWTTSRVTPTATTRVTGATG